MATRQPADSQWHTPGGAGAGNTPGRTASPEKSQKMPPRRAWLTFLLVVLANYALMRFLIPSTGEPVKVPYTLFKQEAQRRNVAQIYSRGSSITGRFRTPVTYPRDSAAARDTASRLGVRGLGARQRNVPRPVTGFATELPAFADLIEGGLLVREF